MSNSAKRMREILNATGAYRLNGQSLIDCELEACAAAIDLLESEMNSVLYNLFAETADDAALDRLEQLYRLQPSTAAAEERRNSVKARLAVNPSRIAAKYLPDMLKAANILGEAIEDNGKIRVFFGRSVGISAQKAMAELATLLPAHLEIIFDETVNWAVLNSFAKEFSRVDSLALTWSQIDAFTREQLEELSQEE